MIWVNYDPKLIESQLLSGIKSSVTFECKIAVLFSENCPALQKQDVISYHLHNKQDLFSLPADDAYVILHSMRVKTDHILRHFYLKRF